VNNHAHVLDGLNDEYLRYLELFINATDLKPFVTGTAQPKMNQAKMNSIPVALPPLAEQLRIVAKVDALMALCDRLESALATADTTRARLLEALLHEALVPQSAALEAAE
jgi:type I restriction enzyme, S subunit